MDSCPTIFPSSRWRASALDDDAFRAQVRNALKTFAPSGGPGLDQEAWDRFATHLRYVPGELNDPATYAVLKQELAATDARLSGGHGHLFYLAIPPSLYDETISTAGRIGHRPEGARSQAAALGPDHHREALRPEPGECRSH